VAWQFAEQRRISSNPDLSPEERRESFEDIFDSEIGDTNLVRAGNIEREVGLRQIYLKFEGGNPSGTQKDRIAFAQAMDVQLCGFDSPERGNAGAVGIHRRFNCFDEPTHARAPDE